MHTNLINQLDKFVGSANSALFSLQHSEREEVGDPLNDDETRLFLPGYSEESRQANIESANRVNALRSLGQEIQGILFENPHLLTGCVAEGLTIDFDGEAIKQREQEEKEASCCDKIFWGQASRNTLVAIQDTQRKVERSKQEALAILYHLDPDRSKSCCRNCVIL